METRFAPMSGAELGALTKAIEEAKQRQQPVGTGSQVSITIQRPETTPRETGRKTEGDGGIRIGDGGDSGDKEVHEYWTWVIPYERRGFAVATPPYTPIGVKTDTHTYTITIPPPPPTGEGEGQRTETSYYPPPPPPTPTPPTAIPAMPPFLIPLLGQSAMPSQYPLAGELARPGAMREVLVL
jgi:hypothetical protein